jgi:hypothetical protein
MEGKRRVVCNRKKVEKLFVTEESRKGRRVDFNGDTKRGLAREGFERGKRIKRGDI